MKKETIWKLESVFKYRFFESVGEPMPLTVKRVTSWKASVDEKATRRWDRCTLMARNALQTAIELRAWQRSEQWNRLVDELRPKIATFIDKVIPNTCVPAEYIQLIKGTLRWDILGICFEEEFRDVVAPIFFISYLDPWYALGHFPCGWTGRAF